MLRQVWTMPRIFCLTLTLMLWLMGCAPPAQDEKENISPGVDVAIVTVIGAEYRAMLKHMDRTVSLQLPLGVTNSYGWVRAEVDRDDAEQLQVIVALAGEAGTTSGALAVTETVRVWQPRVVVLAGIAGGLPPAVTRGDVVISDALWGYEFGDIAEQFNPRRDWTYQSHPPLIRTAAALKSGWQGKITVDKPDDGSAPHLLVGTTASGNKVIETMDSELVKRVMAALPSAVSVEMEGAGAFAAAELLATQPSPPAIVMFRGISDIPKPVSDLLGEKADRERWKRYAADSVAAFTTYYLATGLPDSVLDAAAAQASIDLLTVTCTGTVLDAFRNRFAASISSVTGLTFEATIKSPRYDIPYRMAVQQLQYCEDADELIEAVARYQPKYLLFADLALGISNKVKPGDVVIARLVWRYDETEAGLVTDHALSRRPARAVINAAQSLDSQGLVHAGTIASGTFEPSQVDRALIDQILEINPRSLVADNMSGIFSEAIANHGAETGWPRFVNMQAAHTVLGEEKVDETVAAENLAAVVVELIQQAWPDRPLGN